MAKKTTEEMLAASAGEVAEQSTTANPAGVYVHPETGVKAIAAFHPKHGSAQADAFIRAGYVFEREARPEELAQPTFGNYPVSTDQLSQGVEVRTDSVPRSEFDDLSKALKAQASEIASLRDRATTATNVTIQSPGEEADKQKPGDGKVDINK